MDGANMNAQVGLTSPAAIGADVCHLNLHKTFAIPHGGGGPGMGPIGVAAHLAPFLPGHPLVADRRRAGDSRGVGGAVGQREHPADLVRLHPDARRATGMTDATRYAILNANYIKARLEPHYPVLYTRPNGRVAHEMIFDLRAVQAGDRHRRDGRREAADGLRLPRADGVVPGRRHADGRADRERAEGRARSLLRRDDRRSARRSRRSSTGKADREGQRAEERAAHRGGRDRRRLDASVLARAGGVSAAVRPRATSSGRPSAASTTRTATAT